MYSLISGHLPPGTSLNMTTGHITGVAPDIDATYTFGIRATDIHGKYADGVFSLSVRGYIFKSYSAQNKTKISCFNLKPLPCHLQHIINVSDVFAS